MKHAAGRRTKSCHSNSSGSSVTPLKVCALSFCLSVFCALLSVHRVLSCPISLSVSLRICSFAILSHVAVPIQLRTSSRLTVLKALQECVEIVRHCSTPHDTQHAVPHASRHPVHTPRNPRAPHNTMTTDIPTVPIDHVAPKLRDNHRTIPR